MYFAVFSSATLQLQYLVANDCMLYCISAMFKNFDKAEQQKYTVRGNWKYRDFEYAHYIDEYDLVAQN